VLLTDTLAAEAEVPVRRIAQVLNLMEVVLECLVVAAASSTDSRLVTASAYENAGNHGIVHKGLSTGKPHASRTERRLLLPSVPAWCACHRETLAVLDVYTHGHHAPICQPFWFHGRGEPVLALPA
jgi:hypothetical protein